MISDLIIIYSQNIYVQSEPPIYRQSINKSIQNLSVSAQLSSLRAVYWVCVCGGGGILRPFASEMILSIAYFEIRLTSKSW